MRSWRPPPGLAARALLLASLGLVLGGCGDAARPARPAGSALWLETEELAAVDPAQLDRLREAGVGELFVAGAELGWRGDRPVVEPGRAQGLSRRAPATLVVTGRWPAGALAGPLSDPRRFGRDLGPELDRLRLAAESGGLFVTGVHLDLRGLEAGALEALAEALEEAVGSLGEGRYLSIDLDPDWLGSEGVERLAGAVDFVTCRLYGQPIEERLNGTLWRHDEVLYAARRLEAVGRGYMIAVTTVGGLRRLDADGNTVAAAAGGATLGDLVADRALERAHGGVLEGLDRRVMTFTAQRPTTLAGWQLEAGERVRTVQLREHDLRRLLQLLSAQNLPHHLGELYIRAPSREEGLALSLSGLAGAVSGVASPADLRAELRDVRAVRGGLAFRVAAINAGEGDTDVAYLETNFVDVEVPGGVVASAQPGGFLRYEKRLGGRVASDMQSFRNADSVRLFVPLLEAGRSVVSGPIVVRTRSGRVVVGGTFSLPGGALFEVAESGLP